MDCSETDCWLRGWILGLSPAGPLSQFAIVDFQLWIEVSMLCAGFSVSIYALV
jgi:hypothetical protein